MAQSEAFCGLKMILTGASQSVGRPLTLLTTIIRRHWVGILPLDRSRHLLPDDKKAEASRSQLFSFSGALNQ